MLTSIIFKEIELGVGWHEAARWTSDLNGRYVRFDPEYFP